MKTSYDFPPSPSTRCSLRGPPPSVSQFDKPHPKTNSQCKPHLPQLRCNMSTPSHSLLPRCCQHHQILLACSPKVQLFLCNIRLGSDHIHSRQSKAKAHRKLQVILFNLFPGHLSSPLSLRKLQKSLKIKNSSTLIPYYQMCCMMLHLSLKTFT